VSYRIVSCPLFACFISSCFCRLPSLTSHIRSYTHKHSISEPEFREFFAQFGELQDATVKFDQNTGLPRGFGFVTYIDPEIATFVTKLGDKREGYGRLVMRGKTCEIKAHKENRNKLFVGGLPMDITNNELRDFFQQFGTVVDSIVMVHKENNVPRGFGFVTFAEPDVTDFVLQMRDNNYGSNRDGIGRIVMRGKVCEIKVYNSKEGHPPLPSSSSQKRLRDNDDNFSGGGPKTMKVTTNVHDMKERLPQDFNLPLAIKEYTSSTDIVCFSDDKETSFPYSAVRKVYFWKLLSGSGYYCPEMEQEKKEGGGDQGYRRREHRDQNYDDPMMVTGVGGGNDVVAGALSCPICGGPHRKEKCWDDPKNGHLRPPGWVSRKGINLGNTHDEQHQSMKPHQIGGDHHGRGAVVPYTCPICGGAHRKEKCWDDPKNAHLRPADWMPSATFLSRKGIHAGRPSHTQGGSHNDDQSVRSGGGSGGGSGYVVMCSICKGPHKTEKCWDDPKNAKFRPSTDWRSKEEVKERLHDRDHPGENNHGPFKWRAPEAGENNKRIIDHKPHTYNFSIKGWVDDSVRGKDKWRAPEAGENDRRVIDKKPHNYNYNIKGWVIDPAFARAGGAGPDFNDNRRGSSYGDDPRRNSYGGGGTGTTDRYRDESGGGGDDYRRSSYGGGVVGKPSSGDVSSPAGRYREESDNYGGDDRRGSSYRGGSSPAGRYRDDDSYDGDRRYNGGGGGGGDTSPSGRYRDELDRYRG
jgi:RNA recognition motif-containing protein